MKKIEETQMTAGLVLLQWLFFLAWGLALLAIPERVNADHEPCSSTMPIACHETKTDQELSTMTETDCFTFDAVAGTLVSMLALGTPGQPLSPGDACWKLIGPSGPLSGPYCGARESREATVAGTYTIKVFDNAHNDTGKYSLELDCQLPHECTDTASIAPGETKQGNLSRIIERDCFTFSGVAGTVVSISTTPGDACWTLVDQNKAVISGPRCGVQLSAALPTTGAYTIEVDDHAHNETVNYQISFDWQLAHECTSDLLIGCGETKTGMLDRIIERDCFHFDGASGQQVSIAARGTSGSVGACWKVIAPGGGELTGQICEQQQTILLPTAGAYKIELTDNGSNETGAYEISLDCLPGHFKCYRSKTKPGTPGFAPRNVSLSDQFETKDTQVLKPEALCNPVDKNDEGITDLTAHLTCYTIADVPNQPLFQPHEVLVQNQFGNNVLTVTKPQSLCVPSEKDHAPSPLNVDHFKCYKARPKDRFVQRTVSLEDQFEDKQTKVLRPTALCNPVNKNGEDILHPESHLVCYTIRDLPKQPKFQPRDAFIHNQFGDLTLTASKAQTLCVPSTKTDLGFSLEEGVEEEGDGE